MPMSMFWKRMLVIVAIPTALAAYAKEPASSKPIPVEFWNVGDTRVAQWLQVAIEKAFNSSPEFALSSERKSDTLVVLIPTNARAEDVGKRTRVIFSAEFSTADDRKISTIRGWCWEGEYEKCAAKVVKAARKAARKIRQNEHKSR